MTSLPRSPREQVGAGCDGEPIRAGNRRHRTFAGPRRACDLVDLVVGQRGGARRRDRRVRAACTPKTGTEGPDDARARPAAPRQPRRWPAASFVRRIADSGSRTTSTATTSSDGADHGGDRPDRTDRVAQHARRAGPRLPQSVTGLNGRSSTSKKPMSRIFTMSARRAASAHDRGEADRRRGGKTTATAEHDQGPRSGCGGTRQTRQVVEPVRGDQREPNDQERQRRCVSRGHRRPD